VLVIARTVAHLFRQLREQHRPVTELELVRRAYDFAAPLHSGRFEVDGTPFHAHCLGMASIMAQIGAPAPVIGAAVLHNAYTTGDWGDGRASGAFPRRRRQVRDALGPEVESFLSGLREARAAGHVERLVAHPEVDLDDRARWLALLDLADLLDKWDDGRVRYSTAGRGDRQLVEGREEAIVALAARVGGPLLAHAFESAFLRTATEEIPVSLRLDRRYSVVVPPPSWRPRRSVALLRQFRCVADPWRRRLSRSARR